MKPHLIIVFTLAVFVVSSHGATTRFEIYELSSSDLISSEQLAKALVDEEGTVVLDEKHRRLLISATDEQHEQLTDRTSNEETLDVILVPRIVDPTKNEVE